MNPTRPAAAPSRVQPLSGGWPTTSARHAGALVAGVALALVCGPAAAAGLGAITQQSALGQPLRVVIPVFLAAGEEFPAECLKLVPAEREADGIPQLVFGRVGLEHMPSGSRIVITSARPVDDPVVRVTVQAGCDVTVRREYTLFMDPAPIEAPIVAADSEPRSEPPAAPAPPVAAVAPVRVGAAGAASAPRARSTAGGAGARAARSTAKSAPGKSRAIAKAAPRRAPRPVTGQPRLTVSSAPPRAFDGTATAAGEARPPQSQQELANALEAETIVLQQRIAELSALIDRMQQDVEAGELAQRAADEAAAKELAQRAADEAAAKELAQRAADEAAKLPWWMAALHWLGQNWTTLVAILGLPLLIAAGLLWKRREDAARADVMLASGRAPVRAASVADAQPAAALRNAPAGIPRSQPEPTRTTTTTKTPAQTAADNADALAVSELSQVTEEARVYVALGHPDRAIDVLNEHIRHASKSMPAAWLMLLDLHRASNRRQEFRRVAEEFHLHFNVQTPLWEGFTTSDAGESGLDDYPHLMKQITDRWGRPGCREHLEHLLSDNREGRRIGFPLAAYADILLLLQLIDAPPASGADSAARGKAGTARAEAPPARPPASPPRPEAAVAAQARKPMPPEPTPTVRPSQQPLAFELDLDEHARRVGKKPPS